MKRTCLHCGFERETTSARSRFYCTADACRAKGRKLNRAPRNGYRERLYWERLAKVSARKVKRGEGPDVHGF